MHWRRKWQPKSSILAWRLSGMEEPGGLPSIGLPRLGHNWNDLAAAAACDLMAIFSVKIDIYRAFYPNAAGYTFFSSSHGIFSRIDHLLWHKTSLNKFKRIRIISNIFSGHNSTKLEKNTWSLTVIYKVCYVHPKAMRMTIYVNVRRKPLNINKNVFF